MRLFACTALALTAAACASTAPPQTQRSPFEAVVEPMGDPNEDAIPAGHGQFEPMAQRPAPRLGSAIERMTSQEVVAWLAPEMSGRVWDVAKHRGRMGDYVSISLSEEPRPTGRPGLCEVVQHVYALRIPDERALPPQQYDRPLEPYMKSIHRLFRAGASTLREHTADEARAACWDSPPLERYFGAPSTEAAWRALRFMEQAQAGLRGPRAAGFQFECRELQMNPEGGWHNDTRACADPRARIAALTPHLLSSVRTTPCEGRLSGPGACYEAEYRDPEAQEMGRVWVARFRGGGTVQAAELRQTLLPPH
jgi:hypothetical protein